MRVLIISPSFEPTNYQALHLVKFVEQCKDISDYWLIPYREAAGINKGLSHEDLMKNYKDHEGIKILESKIIEWVNVHNIELIIVQKGDLFKPNFYEELKKMRVPLVNLFPDDPFSYTVLSRHIAHNYDIFFTYSPEAVMTHRDAGVKCFEFYYGVDTEVFKPLDKDKIDEQYHCDVSFVGTAYPHRVRLAKHIKRYCDKKGYIFKVWGTGWRDRDRKFKPWSGHAYLEEANMVYNACKLTWQFKLPKYCGSYIDRPFDVCGAGGVMVTDEFRYRDNEEFKPIFTHGKHLIECDSPVSIMDNIKKYLEKQDLRDEISKNMLEIRESLSIKNILGKVWSKIMEELF